MSSSDGKFFTKVKNAFKSDKRDSTSQASPKKTQKPSTHTTSKDHEDIVDEAYNEGRKFFHRKQKSGASTISDSKSKSSTTGTTTTDAQHHKEILKEAYEEGHKLFHFHAKHGKTPHTPTQTHDAKFATGVGAAAVGAGVGAAAAEAEADATTTPSSSRNVTSPTSGTDKEILAESSVGRVVTSPPRRSREPLDHTITGDFANSKQPTDPTVITGGKVDKDHQPGVDDDGEQNYTEGAKTIEGEGTFFDPKDTQGGLLSASTATTAAAVGAGAGVAAATTRSTSDESKYNERTKAEYNDLSNLKTEPSAYHNDNQGSGIALEDDFDFQGIKEEAYQEGNKQGRVDYQSSAMEEHSTGEKTGGRGTAIVGGSSKVDPAKQREIHEENKSAYNPDGVTGILEQNHHPQGTSTKSNRDVTSSTGGSVPSSHDQSKDSTTGTSQYQNKDSDNSGVSSKGGDASNVASGAKTTSATGAAAVAGSSALAAGIIAAAGSGPDAATGTTSESGVGATLVGNTQANLEDDKKISDLDRELKQTEAKIDNLKQKPSNASSYAVHNEPIQAPKLQDVGDEDDIVVSTPETSSKTNTTGTSAGVAAGATGALGAAAAYLGLKRGSSATKELEPVSSYGASNTVPDSAYTVGKEQSVQDSAFVEGQAAVVNDEAYAAGYKQGKDLYQGIDKNSTQHRDALLGANTTSANEGTKTLDPSAGGSASQTGGLFQSTKDAAIGATVAAAGALGLGGAAAATSGISSSDKNKDTLADAYTSGRSKGETNFKPTGGYASYEDDITKEAYQAGKDKALSEHNATSRAGTDTSSNTGYLAAAGATLAGAVGAVGATLAGGKSSKEQDVEDSLIEDAEKVDPAIAKLPSHRVNKGELAKEETLGKDASVFEKELVNSNERNQWERETDDYNKKHGFTNPKESLLQEAEDVDPSINKLPSHKTNKDQLKKETSLSKTATLPEKEVVYDNEERIWEKETEDYNKSHGFTNPKESLLQEAEDADLAIGRLPAHRTNEKLLKKEETLAPNADFDERELVAENEVREWERETDDYNKKHGFSNPKESLLQEAEDVDPAINKFPSHKTNLKELDNETTLSKQATLPQREVVYSNEEKIWDRETEEYNKSHGFTNPKESLLQEAEDADSAINKLPAHKTNKNELKKEESLGDNVTFTQRDVVENNELNEWERETEDYNVQHGFANPKESLLQEAEDADPRINKLPAYGSSGAVPTASKDASTANKPVYGSTSASIASPTHTTNKSAGTTTAAPDANKDSSSSKGYLAAAGAAIGGAVGYAFGSKNSKEQDVDDSLVQDAEKKDSTIASLPAHKVNEKELKAETTLGPNATLEEKELVNANNRKLWEHETDEYNKSHGFEPPKESLLQEAEDSDTRIATLPAHTSSETIPHSSKNVPSETDATSNSSSKGYLAAAGAALGGAVGAVGSTIAGGNKSSKDQDVDESLLEDAENADPKIASLPPHKVDQRELDRETSLGRNATPAEREAVKSNDRKLWEKETEDYNKKHGFGNPTESLIQEAADVDPDIKKFPAYKANKNELERETTLGAGATVDEKETVYSNDRKLWEKETEEYNKQHGFTGQPESLIAVAEDADPSIAKLPSYKTDPNKLNANATSVQDDNDVQKLPDNYPTARPEEVKKSLAGSAAGIATSSTTTGAATDISEVGLTETDLYQEGYKKGKLEVTSTVYSEAKLPNHQRTISGASYNATKPIGESELPEPNIDNSYVEKLKRDSKSLPAATAVAAAAAGAGVGVAAAEAKKGLSSAKDARSSLEPSFQQEAYNEGYSQGKHPYLGKQQETTGIDPNLKQSSYDTGVAAGIVPNLKQASYDTGYSQGNKGLGSTDPNLKQASYGAGYSQVADVLDEKLKQDLYEHGYAKGSTEAKQERDAHRTGAGSYGSHAGSNHREAAVIGSLGGLAAGAAALGARGSQNQTKPTQDEFIDSRGHSNDVRNNSDENLVVEVIGIEDKDEALRTAKKASKKLDDKGVDLSSGKLVINANTKEIYKDDNYSASGAGTSGSSELGGQKSRDVSSPSTSHQTHESNPFTSSTASDDGGKLDTYQQTEAAKKRLAEAARKNVSSAQKHTQGSSGLTPIEVAALSAGVGSGVAAAEHEKGIERKDRSLSQESPDSSPAQKHKYPDSTDYSGQPPIKKQDTNDSPDITTSSGTTSSSAPVALAAPVAPAATADDEIFVNVKGIKDNTLATKIARTAVARLQKTHAAIVANVKELQVDASSGIVRDENGNEIAQYPDLAIEKINSNKRVASHESKSPIQGSKSPSQQHTKSPSQTPKSPTTSHNHGDNHHHFGHGSPMSLRENKKEPSTGLVSGALAGSVSGGLAAAAAAAAIRKSHDSDRPEITADAAPSAPASSSQSGVSSTDRSVGDSRTGSSNKSVKPSTSAGHHDSAKTTSSGISGANDTTTASSGRSTIPGFNFAGIPGFNGPAPSTSGQSKDSSSSAGGYSEPTTTSTDVGASSNPTVSSSSGIKSTGSNGYNELSKAPKYPDQKEPVSPSLNFTSQQANIPGLDDSVRSDTGGYALDSTSPKKLQTKSNNFGVDTSTEEATSSGVRSAEVPKSFVAPETSAIKHESRTVGSDPTVTGSSNLNSQSTKPVTKAASAEPEDDPNSSFFSFAETSTYSMPGTWTY